MIYTIALNWDCTQCDWTHEADWDRRLTLDDIIVNALRSHAVVSKDCSGELMLTSQFIHSGVDLGKK